MLYYIIQFHDIIDCFRLQAAAAERVVNFKEKSAVGLQYAIEQHNLLDLKIDLQAPIVLIPYGGKYTACENVIVVNLGNLKMYSIDRAPSSINIRRMLAQGKEQSEILKEMIDQSYDQFCLEFTKLQVLLSQVCSVGFLFVFSLITFINISGR